MRGVVVTTTTWSPRSPTAERTSDWRAWKTLLGEAGVREVRLHDGRHTAATLLLSEGVRPRVVMAVLGHAQMRTATDTYGHVERRPSPAMPPNAWATRSGINPAPDLLHSPPR